MDPFKRIEMSFIQALPMTTKDEKMNQRLEDLPKMSREEWCEKHGLALSNWYVYMDKAGLRKQTIRQVRGVRTTAKTTQWNITVENDVHQWVNENIPKGKRSSLVNELVKEYISKQENPE